MLQIASGKLFTSDPTRINNLRGILYSNLLIQEDYIIETSAGRLVPTSFTPGRLRELVYEFQEHIEDPIRPGALVSYGIEPYINDFATVVSLGLNAICTGNVNEALRLTSSGGSSKTGYPPSSFVPRVFEGQINVSETEISEFESFVKDLIALKRKYFLQAMRAIRTYVVALHRLPDDLELSYTLLVASIESIAQSIKECNNSWQDIEPNKRMKVDKVLATVDKQTSSAVKDLLIEFEQPGSGKKFRQFVKKHLRQSFFRREANGIECAIRGVDLEQLLKHAYSHRSRYVHQLSELPKELKVGIFPGETVPLDGKQHLTFRGLARLARHLILGFVVDQPKVIKEEYDYRKERHGVMYASLAAEYWVGDTKYLKLSDGNKRFEGFLTQLSAYLRKEREAKISDIRPMLIKAEELMETGTEQERRPFLVLYLLFNASLPADQKMESAQSIESKYSSELSAPSAEIMLLHMIVRSTPNWDLTDYEAALEKYFCQRNSKLGLRLPQTFETGLLLFLAEQHRLAGNIERAKNLVSQAVESYPGCLELQKIEESFTASQSVDWFTIVFPQSEADTSKCCFQFCCL